MPQKLRVFYGWTKINRIRKKESISVIFENGRNNEDKTSSFINKMQNTVYVREQTELERQAAGDTNRMYTEYTIFMDDKKVKGSLKVALDINDMADKYNVSETERREIRSCLEKAWLCDHCGYTEPKR